MSGTHKTASKAKVLLEIESLNTQIAIQESFRASMIEEDSQRPVVQETIGRLTRARYFLERDLQSSLVLEQVDEDSTDDVLDERRKGQPVKRGANVYLPIAASENVINLPNCLLRSAVFGAVRGGKPLENQNLGSHKNVTIKMTGCQLNAYDRRVLAACLGFYQEPTTARKSARRAPLPLANGIDDSGWNPITYWGLRQAMGRSYGKKVAKAIQTSLVRLNDARLQVSSGDDSLPAMPLVEVLFEDGHSYPMSTEPDGGDTISFRVLDSFASLYILGGDKALTKIDKAGLMTYTQALPSWLACYYSSHQRPFKTHIENLRTYCGATSTRKAFQSLLKNALTEFQSPETPNQFRVSRFELTKTEVTVHLARWKS